MTQCTPSNLYGFDLYIGPDRMARIEFPADMTTDECARLFKGLDMLQAFVRQQTATRSKAPARSIIMTGSGVMTLSGFEIPWQEISSIALRSKVSRGLLAPVDSDNGLCIVVVVAHGAQSLPLTSLLPRAEAEATKLELERNLGFACEDPESE